jgi:hypothetical protein
MISNDNITKPGFRRQYTDVTNTRRINMFPGPRKSYFFYQGIYFKGSIKY